MPDDAATKWAALRRESDKRRKDKRYAEQCDAELAIDALGAYGETATEDEWPKIYEAIKWLKTFT